jgi:hypothetical protein
VRHATIDRSALLESLTGLEELIQHMRRREERESVSSQVVLMVYMLTWHTQPLTWNRWGCNCSPNPWTPPQEAVMRGRLVPSPLLA